MIAPFIFFPECASGIGWGRHQFATSRENACVLQRVAYNAARWGSASAGRKATFAFGSFLDWAAKPSVRKLPEPPQILPGSRFRHRLFLLSLPVTFA